MGNKRIIITANNTRRKVCEKTQKVVLETNFCYCGRKHCAEGFRMNSQKALCKVRRFREKFRPIVIDDDYDGEDCEQEKIEFETTNYIVPTPCSTTTVSILAFGQQ
jgi:hypothetical protein